MEKKKPIQNKALREDRNLRGVYTVSKPESLPPLSIERLEENIKNPPVDSFLPKKQDKRSC
ncbi:MAG: hypothetical protein HZA23_00795 [Nitrospirae bacterium]|nr:hypothetical protein [Nitrospirota bacterium]